MTRRPLPALVLGAIGLALTACSTDAGHVVPEQAGGAQAQPNEGQLAGDAHQAQDANADSHQGHAHHPGDGHDHGELPSGYVIPKADPPPPVDLIGVQDNTGMAWAGKVLHKDRMRWKAPDPLVDYFIVVIRELTPHHEKLGLEVGKAYRFRGHNTYEFIREVDLSQTNRELAASFGAFTKKPIDLLMEGVTNDDVAAVRAALDEGMGPDTRNRGERPVLMVAAREGSLNVIKLLLEAGATIDLVDKAGETALHQAARHGHPEVCAYLLEQGASLTAKDHFGHTALFFAAEANSPETARVLIENGADVTIKDERGYTVLAYAKVFLRRRFDPELKELLTPKQ